MSKKLIKSVPQETVEKLIPQICSMLKKEPLKKMYTFSIIEPLRSYADGVNSGDSNWAKDLSNKKDLNSFEMTLMLREKMKTELEYAEGEKRNQIAKWIVKKWGGIKTVTDNNLNNSIDSAERHHEKCNGEFDFERIASWSKFMAFKYPQQYAIYDARVIYSLNWLLLGTKTGEEPKKKEVGEEGELKFFPFLDGQNSVMGLLNYNIHLLLSHYQGDTLINALETDINTRGNRSRLRSRLERGLFIPQQAAYSEYCGLLKKLAENIYPDINGAPDIHRLTKIEMMLFSIADKAIALEVMKFLTGKHPQCPLPAT